jgi:hypothetical protein
LKYVYFQECDLAKPTCLVIDGASSGKYVQIKGQYLVFNQRSTQAVKRLKISVRLKQMT